jgi:hypothetical protein
MNFGMVSWRRTPNLEGLPAERQSSDFTWPHVMTKKTDQTDFNKNAISSAQISSKNLYRLPNENVK